MAVLVFADKQIHDKISYMVLCKIFYQEIKMRYRLLSYSFSTMIVLVMYMIVTESITRVVVSENNYRQVYVTQTEETKRVKIWQTEETKREQIKADLEQSINPIYVLSILNRNMLIIIISVLALTFFALCFFIAKSLN